MAWSNLGTKTDAVDTFAAADVNTLMENIRVVAGNGNNAPSDDCTSLDSRVTVLEGGGLGEYAAKTLAEGGFWGDIVWQDADQIQIKAKPADGLSPFVGAYLNDGSFIRLSVSTDFIFKYDTPANSGHILDGITAKLNNEWFILWAYKDSGNALAFGSTWMPQCTSTAANPTKTVTTAQVNGQDIGYLFPVGAHVALWQDTDEYETPLYYSNVSLGAYSPTASACVVSSRVSTNIVLSENLRNADFTNKTIVYQVDGFKPLNVSDGNVAAAIGANGYRDTGFRFITDGSGNIIRFEKRNDLILFVISSDYNFSYTATKTNYRMNLYCPPDCNIIYAGLLGQNTGAPSLLAHYCCMYYSDYNVFQAGMYGLGLCVSSLPILHSIIRLSGTTVGAVAYIYIYGWYIK